MESTARAADERLAGDVAAIEAAVRDYIEGWYSGDAERMDRALHDDLVKRTPTGEAEADLRNVRKDRMIELTSAGGGEMPDAAYEIHIDDVSDDIATVRLGSPEYLDYLHLAKTSDGWSIVNVLFHVVD
ncbi:MAG: nuclear transport factor 2 family protein [Acidimicrobiia bacterium]|nr:nuclear transport factor 2 family protein [Acidimicrobiia bacterium]